MSSAAAGTRNDATQGQNAASTDLPFGAAGAPAVCSTTSAEAEQGNGPAASSASAAGSSEGETITTAVSTSASSDYAAASCPIAVVAVGPNAAAAASEKCAATVSLTAASASGTAANGVDTTVLPEAQAEACAEALRVFKTIRADLEAYQNAVAAERPPVAAQNSDDLPVARNQPKPESVSAPSLVNDDQTKPERKNHMSNANTDVSNRLAAIEQLIKNQSVQDEVQVLKDNLRNITSQNQDIRNDILDLQREVMKASSANAKSAAPAD